MSEAVHVSCAEQWAGWECRVSTGTTQHVVSVSSSVLARFAPGHHEPTRLVEESYRFLLEREPASAILRRFELSDIEHYFPEFPTEIASRI